MGSTASLEELATAISNSPFAPGRNFGTTYLAPIGGSNPRKSTDPTDEPSVYVFTDTYNRPAVIPMFLFANKLPTVSNQRSFTQLGEYFNLWIDSNMTTFSQDKLKGARASLCCDFLTPDLTNVPTNVVQNSINSMKTLYNIHEGTEAWFNRFAPVSSVTSSLVRNSITGQDAVVTVLHTPRLFDCGSVRLNGLGMKASFDNDVLPPSVMKQRHAEKRANNKGITSPIWLDDLPDSRGLYGATMDKLNAHKCIYLTPPNVRDFNGNVISPVSYESSIVDRQLVLAECHLKMWHFEPNRQKKINYHSRIYHVVIKDLHLLRLVPDERKRQLIASIEAQATAFSQAPSVANQGAAPADVPVAVSSADPTGDSVQEFGSSALVQEDVSNDSVLVGSPDGSGNDVGGVVHTIGEDDGVRQASDTDAPPEPAKGLTEGSRKSLNTQTSVEGDEVRESSTSSAVTSVEGVAPASPGLADGQVGRTRRGRVGGVAGKDASPAKRPADSPAMGSKTKQSRSN
ncbi:hypothetical protein AAF712_013429 [Marasmius tenuissimus]|uniref:Uncharacterized protein n=1 Tax=Marasmius tenuissimus TaxID=585030 RepID=A0ABR2ZEP1_9AGAR